MRRYIILVTCLLLAGVFCAPSNEIGQGQDDHSHGNHSHGEQGHGDHNQGEHSQGEHGHGEHNQEHSGHGHHGHGHHGHGQHEHDHHGHGQHEHDHHGHGHGGHGHHGHGHGVRFRDCAEHQNAGHTTTGTYRIKPDGCHHPIRVMCDMTTDGGGWTIIQKRGEFGNPENFFEKSWDEYKNGFGDFEKEVWIGNYHINHLAEQGKYELRIDMKSLSDNETYAKYGTFKVGNESTNYALEVGDFSGNTRDCMAFINGMAFSTHDRDNDQYTGSCAQEGRGAWWYKDCSSSNLNGPHMSNPQGNVSHSIYWFDLDGQPTLLKETKMMVRPKPLSNYTQIENI